jgi:hypothetical protein
VTSDPRSRPPDATSKPSKPVGRTPRVDAIVFAFLVALACAIAGTVRFPPDVDVRRAVVPAEVAASPPAHVQDFAYVFNYARWAAARPGRSPYGLAEHRAFLTAWLGPHVRSALCFAYGPTMVLVLAPLFVLTTRWAWLAWNVVGAASTSGAVARLAAGDAIGRWWGRAAVTGTTAFLCLVHGQTALAAVGCFVGAVESRDTRTLRAVTCLVLLTAKPPLALIAAVALVVSGGAATVAIAAAVAALVLLSAVLWWTPTTLADYATLVAHYNLVDADELVRAGFVPWSMTNLRSMCLRLGLDDAQAFRASGAAFAIALALPIAAVGWRRSRLSHELAASFAVLAYLLFSPHLSTTEDVLLVVPLLLVLRAGRASRWQRVCLIAGCVAPQWVNETTLQLVWHGHPAALADALPAVTFALKCAAGAIVCRMLYAESFSA